MRLVKLVDIAANEKNAIVDGPFGSSMKTSDYVKEGVPVLQGKNITGDRFVFSDIRFISEQKAKELLRSKVTVGDYLLVKIGSIGYLARINSLEKFPFAIIPANLCKIKIDESKVYPTYFEQVFKQRFIKRNLLNLSSKTAQPALSLGKIKSFEIPIPNSLSDQIYIGDILTKAENLITQRKESIRLLDEYVKSTFLEMFGDPVRNEKGWVELSGGDYLEKLTVGVVIKPASHYVDKGVIALRSLNIRPNRIELNNLVYFSKEASEKELSKSILREGDVVFVRTGMTGTAAIIPKQLDGCNCIDLIITRPKSEKMHAKYLVFFFNSDFGKRRVASKEVGGIQKHFNIGAMKELKIPVPPIELQTRFAQIADKIELLKKEYQRSLKELENLYNSLSQRAFKGELKISNSGVANAV